MYSSKTDGIDHINIYSKAQTQLGKFLSNFEYHPIDTEDGKFNSIEGYWYWLGCSHSEKDRLRYLSGFSAKKVGRELGCNDWLEGKTFKDKIRKAIDIKINTMPEYYKNRFIKSTLPFTHYYEYGDKVVKIPKANWIIKHIEEIRKKFQNENNSN